MWLNVSNWHLKGCPKLCMPLRLELSIRKEKRKKSHRYWQQLQCLFCTSIEKKKMRHSTELFSKVVPKKKRESSKKRCIWYSVGWEMSVIIFEYFVLTCVSSLSNYTLRFFCRPFAACDTKVRAKNMAKICDAQVFFKFFFLFFGCHHFNLIFFCESNMPIMHIISIQLMKTCTFSHLLARGGERCRRSGIACVLVRVLCHIWMGYTAQTNPSIIFNLHQNDFTFHIFAALSYIQCKML